MVKASPLTPIAPVLGDTTEFAATENWKDPSPCPCVVPDNEIHGAPAVADQVQSRSVLTDTVPLPPDAGNAVGEPDSETWHRDGEVADVRDVPPQLDAPMAAATRATSTHARRQRPARFDVGSTAANASKRQAR